MTKSNLGLEGVVAVETALSSVDGERGCLVLRGHRVETLAPHARFEDALGLLVGGKLPDTDERHRLSELLGRQRVRAHELLVGVRPDLSDAMSAARAAVASLDEADIGESPLEQAALLAGAIAVRVTSWSRRRQGLSPIAPDPSLGHAEDFLRMLSGERPSGAEADALGVYWVTVSDHGMNASTFTARVVASTGSDLVSAVSAAIGALKGPLHGGAPGPVLDMLDAIGSESNVRGWLQRELTAGRRIMGMGHRVYRVRDPRALVLEGALERFTTQLAARSDERTAATRERLSLARATEREAERLLAELHADRALRANVEFYTALLLEAVGVPRELFSATFASSRVLGWVAHVLEQRQVGRLIRPASRYVGPDPEATEYPNPVP